MLTSGLKKKKNLNFAPFNGGVWALLQCCASPQKEIPVTLKWSPLTSLKYCCSVFLFSAEVCQKQRFPGGKFLL